MIMTDYAMTPGLTTSRETYEAEFRWGSEYQGVFANALISGSTVDTGNSPTFELRPGLLLGQQITTGKYANYNPLATDGSEVATAVLIEGLRTLDYANNPQDKFYAVLVGGPVQAGKLLNLDYNARQQMDKFIFDDVFNLPGGHWFPFKRFQSKTANYTMAIPNDNYSHFDNTGATGAVVLTLPPIAPGYMIGMTATVAQSLTIASNEGGNLVGDAALQSSVEVAAIGGGVIVYSNPAGTRWFVQNTSSYTQVLTFA